MAQQTKKESERPRPFTINTASLETKILVPASHGTPLTRRPQEGSNFDSVDTSGSSPRQTPFRSPHLGGNRPPSGDQWDFRSKLTTLIPIAKALPQPKSDFYSIDSLSIMTCVFPFVLSAVANSEESGLALYKGVLGAFADAVKRFNGEVLSCGIKNTFTVGWNAGKSQSHHQKEAVDCALSLAQVFRPFRELGIPIGISVTTGSAFRGSISTHSDELPLLISSCTEMGKHLAELSSIIPGIRGVVVSDAVRQAVSIHFDSILVDVISSPENQRAGLPAANIFEIRRSGTFRSALEDKRTAAFSDSTGSNSRPSTASPGNTPTTSPTTVTDKHVQAFQIYFNQAFFHFRRHQFKDALRYIKKIRKEIPALVNDPQVERVAQACERFLATPPRSLPNPIVRLIPQWCVYENDQEDDIHRAALADDASLQQKIVEQRQSVSPAAEEEKRSSSNNGHSGSGEGMLSSGNREEKIIDSWSLLEEMNANNVVGLRFYENLLAADPHVGVFFGDTDINVQAKVLFNMMGQTVKLLAVKQSDNDSDFTVSYLQELGVKHTRMGVSASQLELFTRALLKTFEEFLAERFTPVLKREWLITFSTITGLIVHGMANADAQVAKKQFDLKVDTLMVELWSNCFFAIEEKSQLQGRTTSKESLLIRTWHRRSIVKNPKLRHIPFFFESKNDGIVFRFLTSVIDALRTSREEATKLLHACGQRHIRYTVSVSDFEITEESFLEACREIMTIYEKPLLIVEEDRLKRFIHIVSEGLATGLVTQLAKESQMQVAPPISPECPSSAASSATAPSSATWASPMSVFSADLHRAVEKGKEQEQGIQPPRIVCPFAPPTPTGPLNSIRTNSSNRTSTQNNANHTTDSFSSCALTDDEEESEGLLSNRQPSSQRISASLDEYGRSLNTQQQMSRSTRTSASLPTLIFSRHGAEYVRSTKVLGKGTFGCVYLGMEKHSSRLVAMKTLPLPRETSVIQAIATEVEILERCQHANVVQFYGYAIVSNQIVLIMECVAAGSLAAMLEGFGTMPTVSVLNLTRDVLRGLMKLHSMGVLHRDVKPQNVLLATSGQAKLTDFGASAKLADIARQGGHAVQGTALYLAPEAARGAPVAASDIWAVGIMFLQLTTGEIPYDIDIETIEPFALVWRLGAGKLRPRWSDDLDSRVEHFLSGCLTMEPEKRMTASELLELPLFL